MSSTARISLIVIGTLIIGLGGSYALAFLSESKTWIPIGLSIASLAIAILAAFKNELFDFNPTVIGGDFGLIHSSQSNTKSGVLLPLYFFNRGYGEGAILSLGLEAENKSREETYLLTPAAEIDLQLLMKNTGRIHGSNIIGPFISFPLESKQVVSKCIAFNWMSENIDDSKYAPPRLEPNIYTFRLLVLTDHSPSSKVLLEFDHIFNQEVIDSFNDGNAIFNMKAGPWCE